MEKELNEDFPQPDEKQKGPHQLIQPTDTYLLHFELYECCFLSCIKSFTTYLDIMQVLVVVIIVIGSFIGLAGWF